MSDAVSSLNLQRLEQDLQNRLHAELAHSQLMQVRCVFKEGILITLVQHGQPALPYPRRVFRVIRQFLYESAVLKQHQVLMYLRVEGSNQPYAFHTLTEQSKELMEDIAPVVEEPQAIANEEEDLDDFSSELPETEPESFVGTGSDFEGNTAGFDADTDPGEEFGQYDEPEEIGFEGFTSVDGSFEESSTVAEGDELGDRRLGKATLIFAACLALAFSTTAFYVLTRPCVLGSCQTLDRADKLSDQAISTFQSNPSGQQILTAQGQLKQAVKSLEAIPFWSPHYTEAQKTLKDYRDLSASLDSVINALFKASAAAQMSQNPPFPEAKWSEIAAKWKEAIAGLSAVPPQDFFHPFAQSKIADYERNLSVIELRLKQEKESIDILAQAQEEAKIAQVQQGVAQSLDSWEQAYLSWSAAVQKLESIPAGTTSYQEAQDLIQSYTPQMSSTKESQDKETLAQSIYDQGIRISQLARDAEVAEDWQQAAFHWKNAIRYMQEVPKDTYVSSLAEPAIAQFTQAIESSKVKLQLFNRLKQAETDLERTCVGNPNICTFTIDAKVINIRLTAAYVDQVQKNAVQASATNNNDAKIRILDHIATLEQALEVISRNANIPVQVYDTNGVLLVDYKP
jgi:hypothetical protein